MKEILKLINQRSAKKDVCMCSDSQILLSWILNNKYIVSKVINHNVQQIRDSTFRKAWQNVGTELNLADKLTKSVEK
jgi:hypothetical protein